MVLLLEVGGKFLGSSGKSLHWIGDWVGPIGEENIYAAVGI
jgi:hypothetical protein